MPRFGITESEADALIALPKQIKANLSWTVKPNKSWAASKLPVKSEYEGQLELIITLNMEEPSMFSMTLLLNGAYRIRGLDVRGSHHNKCSDGKRWYRQTHKHPWTDSCPGGHAYTPEDITGATLQEVFSQFCAECNISFRGQFRPAPIQSELPGI